ncbi:MAG: DNA polymerase III subunit gamma/tau, partial [Micropepsaceae bacterium]
MGKKDQGGHTPPGTYRVLARTYRPQSFDDLIGQEAMVRVLKASFETGRIPHAYMLTGVRGVGKTTTARLLARALNYTDDKNTSTPTLIFDQPGIHCGAIAESRHLDVLEMDAASRTGIDDVREIIEAAQFKPASAPFKIYIIDEVHMLSKAAFNGLLKILEEPPEHVKFIFATTEVRKVPVTVLSRCQRFDLKRVMPQQMVAHLASVAKKEGIDVAETALMPIARASEGSVRDALSLLDQAIA